MPLEEIPNIEQLQGNPELVADMQVGLAKQWADIYYGEGEIGDQSAEIVLRNPSAFLHDADASSLPDELKGRWEQLDRFADKVAEIADIRGTKWNGTTYGLEKIQSLVSSGELDSRFRGTVADIMRNSSVLFAESTKMAPGNTKYYAGNIVGAASWLRNRAA